MNGGSGTTDPYSTPDQSCDQQTTASMNTYQGDLASVIITSPLGLTGESLRS